MNLFDLTGKVAIVTGSSRGIGRAIAEAFAEAGARVVISSRNQGPCDEVAAAIRARGGEAIAITARISDKAQIENLVAKTREQWGGIDILVCNAAINPHYGSLEALADQVFERMMTNNVLSNLWLSNLVAPDMKARRDGSIIFISSIGGLKSSTVIAMYGVTKAADIALCRSLAAEWGPHGIRVNCIAPGHIATEMTPYDMAAVVRLTQPLQRQGTAHDVADAVLYLASERSAQITGVVLPVDGGTTAGAPAGRLKEALRR
jgi:NAD(P)-dependent dehydrogenase (short-subunit alcohol dehydrogenase family)